ncbi:MAG: hypothetical protein WC971_10085 [Coriobacteriia bacterium]
MPAAVLDRVPPATVDWLLEPGDPAVTVLTRRTLLGETDSPEAAALWARRNDSPPVSTILDAMRPDGSWMTPAHDYDKYHGSLWQVHLLGELWADGTDERVRLAADNAFSRQLPDGSWSANGKTSSAIPCLTANVGRALARLGFARDERVVRALGYCSDLRRSVGALDCSFGLPYQLNGYCHMLAPKTLLFLAEVPRDLWPDGAGELRDAAVDALRDKEIFRSLPAEYKDFQDKVWSAPSAEREAVRDAFIAEHPVLHYKDKPGWLRFGFPLSYNSDALEALAALAAVGEERRPEYETALAVVESAADPQMRWKMRNSLNGKMYADVEAKGAPSKWLTLRALQVLEHFRG